MLFYLLFYVVIFGFVMLIVSVSESRLSSLKISFISFSISASLLLIWNFFLGPLLMGNSLSDGVSILLSSMLSIVILFAYSAILFALQHALSRVAKRKKENKEVGS